MKYGQIKEVLDEFGFAEIRGFEFSKDDQSVYWFSDDGEDLYSCDFEELMRMVERYIKSEFAEWYAIPMLHSFENVEFED
ncbi:MAG: hypothetical protein ACRCZ0_01700 [Cetobacterium sp.]